jgi:protein-disulfide isomerase
MASSSQGFFDGNPKMLYVFGLVSGIALTLLLNTVIPGVNAANTGTPRAAAPTVVQPTADAPEPAAGPLAEVTSADHVRGNLKTAKVVLVEYSDFECPFCSRHHPVMQQVIDTYGDDVAWVYRHFPLSFHPEAMPAAIASECAAQQGKFWEYGDALIAGQDKLGAAFYADLATQLGLNMNKFNSCLTDPATQALVDEDIQSGSTAGVSGTPATFVNGQLVSGAVPFASFKQMIDAELAK